MALKDKYSVLFVGHVYPALHGAAVAAVHFVEGLNNNAVETHIVNTVYNSSLTTLENFSIKKIFSLGKYIREFLFVLTDHKVEAVVIMHSLRWGAFYKDMVFVRLAALFRKRVILYAQGIGFDTLFYETLSPRRKRFINAVFKKVSDVVMVSHSMVSEYDNWFAKKQMHIIYNVCHPVLTEDRLHYRDNSKTVSLLFVGAIIEAKGIFDLLEVFKTISQKDNRLRLIVCGSFFGSRPQDKTRFELFIKDNKLESVIDFRGVVSGEAKENAFADADIFVLPTHRESFGIVNIEAMSAGLPVISTTQGAIPEYIYDDINGFLIEPQDRKALEEKIQLLISDSALRRRIGEQNRKDFFDKFSLSNFQKKWQDVLINKF